MTVGHSETEANAIVDALSGTWLQLHVGDPGAAGTANVATTTTRLQLTLNAADDGAATNSNVLEWTTDSGPVSEDFTHFSLWSAASAGNFAFSGTLTADPVLGGDPFRIAVGALTISHTTAS